MSAEAAEAVDVTALLAAYRAEWPEPLQRLNLSVARRRLRGIPVPPADIAALAAGIAAWRAAHPDAADAADAPNKERTPMSTTPPAEVDRTFTRPAPAAPAAATAAALSLPSLQALPAIPAVPEKMAPHEAAERFLEALVAEADKRAGAKRAQAAALLAEAEELEKGMRGIAHALRAMRKAGRRAGVGPAGAGAAPALQRAAAGDATLVGQLREWAATRGDTFTTAAALAAVDRTANYASIASAVQQLYRDGLIERVSRGVYRRAAPNAAA